MPLAPTPELPLAIIGAGPIGLAAAADAVGRGIPVTVFEQGQVGDTVAQWGHVRLFSAWRELIAPAARTLLEATGWQAPDEDQYPTGAEWVSQYLLPLAAALTEVGVTIRTETRVTAVARAGRDRIVDSGRDDTPFAIHVVSGDAEDRTLAGAVIDASGTWTTPNPLGAEGVPAIGERSHQARIFYGIPDFRAPATRARYAGKHVLVAGKGASAQNVLVGLAELVTAAADTTATWVLRRHDVDAAFGGEGADELEARGALGARARAAAATPGLTTRTGFRTTAVELSADRRLVVSSDTGERVDGVDEIIVVTGFRPDLTWLSEVRLDVDPVLSAPTALAPLIDPNQHSCGTVYPHGATELAQPETGLYLAGMKSYGRATSFLAMTGFEQVRSIVAEIAGDHEAAARVDLVLPESGVCGGTGAFDEAPIDGGGCCGDPAVPAETLTIGSLSAH